MGYKYVLVEKEDGIATITLNRPDRLNALIPPMRVEIRMALEDADADGSIRAIILTGAGRAFCSGADIVNIYEDKELASDEPQRERLMQPVQTTRVEAAIRAVKKPVICALNGVVAGSAGGIMMTCDIIIASDQARYRLGFTRMGIAPVDAVSFLLPRRIGPHRALELAFTNDIIDAGEMERIGLVNRVVPHDKLMTSAREMAKKMFLIPPLTLALAKKCIYEGMAASSVESHGILEHFAEKTLQATEDTKEAQKSFLEKREPVYKGM